MTYAEFAAARGVSTASATRMVQRKKWRRQPGNDGTTVRVAVPIDSLPVRDTTAAATPAATPDSVAPLVAVLDAALTALREQLEHERGRADRAEAREAELRMAMEALLEANGAKKARRRWARLRVAWRGD